MRKPLASHEDCRIFSEPIGVPERKTVLVASVFSEPIGVPERKTVLVASATPQDYSIQYDVDCRVPAEVRPAALPHYKVGGCYVCAHPTRPSRPSDSGIPVCDECWAAIRD